VDNRENALYVGTELYTVCYIDIGAVVSVDNASVLPYGLTGFPIVTTAAAAIIIIVTKSNIPLYTFHISFLCKVRRKKRVSKKYRKI
jgi:hypothetical protein